MSKSQTLVILMALAYAATSPAQTCKIGTIPSTTPTERFILHGDGTVSDTQTGLMWKQCAEGQSGAECAGDAEGFTWSEALRRAEALNNAGGFAGYRDWRLPNIKELYSIVERQCYEPAINLTIFPNTSSWFWSSSLVVGNSRRAKDVYFSYGDGQWHLKDDNLRVRLVRREQ